MLTVQLCIIKADNDNISYFRDLMTSMNQMGSNRRRSPTLELLCNNMAMKWTCPYLWMQTGRRRIVRLYKISRWWLYRLTLIPKETSALPTIVRLFPQVLVKVGWPISSLKIQRKQLNIIEHAMWIKYNCTIGK